MQSPENFVRSLLERAIEDDLVCPSETTRSIDEANSDLSYLHHVEPEELAGVVGMLKRYVDEVVAELVAARK